MFQGTLFNRNIVCSSCESNDKFSFFFPKVQIISLAVIKIRIPGPSESFILIHNVAVWDLLGEDTMLMS